MKHRHRFRLSRIQTSAVLLTLLFCAESAQAAMLGEMKADKILFLGNSITHHPPWPSISWTGDWGMAASEESKDYVHVLASSIAELTGSMPEVMAPINGYIFEQNYTTYDIAANLQEALDFQADIVVVALGENVATLNSQTQPQFASAFTNLLTTFKNNSNAEIFVRSRFWPEAVIGRNDAAVYRCCRRRVGGPEQSLPRSTELRPRAGFLERNLSRFA